MNNGSVTESRTTVKPREGYWAKVDADLYAVGRGSAPLLFRDASSNLAAASQRFAPTYTRHEKR